MSLSRVESVARRCVELIMEQRASDVCNGVWAVLIEYNVGVNGCYFGF